MSESGKIDTKRRILQAAAHLFARHGFHSVSTRQITEAANVTTPMLYYYFGDKNGLCRTLIEMGLDLDEQDTREIVAMDTPVEERIRTYVKRKFKAATTNPDVVRFYIHFFTGPDITGMRESYKERAMQTRTLVVGMVSEGIERGEFRSDVPVDVATDMLAGLVGVLIGKYIMMEESEIPDEVADDFINLLLNGLR